MYRLNDADPSQLIRFANAWAKLGTAVQEQVQAVLEDIDSAYEQNPNALGLAREKLSGYNEEIEQVLDEALEMISNPPCEECGSLPGEGATAGCSGCDAR